MSKINVADIARAISLSSASITGAIAAMAEPPQIPVPAEIRFESFQSSPKHHYHQRHFADFKYYIYTEGCAEKDNGKFKHLF